MKKSLLALGAAAIALSGMAATPKHQLQASPLQMDRSKEVKSAGRLHAGPASSRMTKAPAKIDYVGNVITEVEGVKQEMTAVGSGLYVYYFYLMEYTDQEAAAHIVYGDNNEVYFCNIIPNAATDTYAKGIKNGDKIEVSLPQTLTWNEDYGYGYELNLFEYIEEVDENGEVSGWYYPVEDRESITFTVAEDGSMTADGLNEDLMLGLGWTDDASWAYYGAYELSLTPFTGTPVSVPGDIEVSKDFWTLDAGEYGWPVSWAQGYDEFYFQNLCTRIPGAWVKGTVEYDDDAATISVAQDQYLTTYGGYYVFTKAAKLVYDEEYDYDYFEYMPADYVYELIWNYEDNTIVAKDPEVYLIFNASKTGDVYIDYMNDIKLVHQDDYAGIPANPYDLSFDASLYADEYDPYGAFLFNVPALSTEGDFLASADLSYVVYVDGEEWEFYADEYELEENMVEIPWDFSVYYIYNYGGAKREVDFFVEGISTLGVQSVYRYNGEETRSEIVTLDLEGDPSGVAVIGSGKKVADVKYYDLSGRQVANPAEGIFVKRVTFEDGTVATFKKAIR